MWYDTTVLCFFAEEKRSNLKDLQWYQFGMTLTTKSVTRETNLVSQDRMSRVYHCAPLT